MKKLTFLLVFISIFGYAQTPITDANIQTAVDLWISDPSAATITYGNISDWDVSNVTNMSNLFRDTPFNQDISSWDVSSVTTMRRMFYLNIEFNQNIGSWNVSNVTDMYEMFLGTISFNQDIGSWNVSKVTTMFGMFSGYNHTFNQDISSWNVSSVTNMGYMFYFSPSFNQNISGWCVTNITSEPTRFSPGSPLTVSNKPIWGTCVDTTVPVITLTGDATVTIEVGSTYTDAGATANDNYDGDITSSIVTVNNVDTSVLGTYTITYNVSDANGNAAVEVTRTVNVVDTTVPVITLEGEATVTLEVGTSYTDAGATANDNYDGDITDTIVIVNNVDSAVVGTYAVTYNVSDANGNAAEEVTRTVIIESSLSTEDNTMNIIKVYPNPVKDKLFISGNKTPIAVSIYNVLGKEVLSIKNTNNINVQALPSGVYMIRISDGVGQTNRKFIKN